jgi:hypothetical protein
LDLRFLQAAEVTAKHKNEAEAMAKASLEAARNKADAARRDAVTNFAFCAQMLTCVNRAARPPHGRPAAAAAVAEALKKKSDRKVELQRLKQQKKQDLARLIRSIDERERELRRSLLVLSGRARVEDDGQLKLLQTRLRELKSE